MGVAMALGQTVVLQRKFDPEDWLRLVDTYGRVDVRGADADPDDLQPAADVKARTTARRCGS
jgi:fatty-acyl-CoA synthase/long-chain acyl-CoA synthetase